MTSKDYFRYFGIPVSFVIDEKKLKESYLTKSREFHPDYFTLHDETTRENVLLQSSYNNKAYNTLKDPMKRLKYILDLHGVIENENEDSLPHEFLMEMMDINELMIELAADRNPQAEKTIRESIRKIEEKLKVEVTPIFEHYNYDNASEDDLSMIKDYYYKSRYLWRLKENLNKFATTK